jgi:hypothetical protein
MVSSQQSSRLGDLLIAKGLLSQEQLANAIASQKSLSDGNDRVLLGEVLIRLGYVNREQLNIGLDWQTKLRRTTVALALCAPVMFFCNNLFANPLRDRPLNIEAEHFSLMQGVQIEATTDTQSDRNVGSISTNDWMLYKAIHIPESGNYRITLRVASLSGGGQLALEVSDGRRIALVSIPKTNGWQAWQDVTVDVEMTQGFHDLKFVAVTGGFNLNWYRIESIDPGPVSFFIKGSEYKDMRGVQLENCTDEGGGQNVSYIDTDDFMTYDFASTPLPVTGSYQLTYRVSSNKSGSRLELRDPLTQNVIDSFVVPNTNGWQKWVDVVRTVELPVSTQTLQIYAGYGGFNFNWLKIKSINKPSSALPLANLPLTIPANQYSAMYGVQTEPTSDIGGGNNVSYIHKDDWLLYGNHPLHVPYAGRYKLSFRIASLSEKGEFVIVDKHGQTISRVSVPVTGAWQKWSTIETIVDLAAGTQLLDMRITKGGFNLNWIRVEPVDKPTSLQVLGADYSAMSGIQLQQTEDVGGGLNVSYVDPGDWLRFDHQPFKVPVEGKYKLTYRVASPTTGGTIRLVAADTSVVFDTSAVPITGAWQRWRNVEKIITLPAGLHRFSLEMVSGFYNFNWFSLEPIEQNGEISSSSSSSITSSSFSSTTSQGVSSTSSTIGLGAVPISPSSSPVSSSSSSQVSSSLSIGQPPVSDMPSLYPTSVPETHSLEGSVGIRWLPPTARQDGRYLDMTEIGGYVIRYKRIKDKGFIYIDIKDPWTDGYIFNALPKGDYFIQIAAFDRDGVFSPFSDIQWVDPTP